MSNRFRDGWGVYGVLTSAGPSRMAYRAAALMVVAAVTAGVTAGVAALEQGAAAALDLDAPAEGALGRNGVEVWTFDGTAGTNDDAAVLLYAPEAQVPDMSDGEVFRDCDFCPKMAVIPAGTFRRGSPASKEGNGEDRVTLKSFALGVTEVTFDEWDACVRGGGCGGRYPDDEGWGRGARPVINVTWAAARVYARWLSRETGKSYRLPSEAEWEYAARGGTTTSWYWGDSSQCEHANAADASLMQVQDGEPWWASRSAPAACDDGAAYTAPVGSYLPNAFGLFDMLGNVSEWMDCQRLPSVDGRVFCSARGGSWKEPLAENNYDGSSSSSQLDDLGFRVARAMD